MVAGDPGEEEEYGADNEREVGSIDADSSGFRGVISSFFVCCANGDAGHDSDSENEGDVEKVVCHGESGEFGNSELGYHDGVYESE